ncbi:MAG: 2-amino-4-hydroxy-6-hydroxymethyldihydropteridine diphosphokinase [Burkholderiaceae bacterium]|nr:2-amino-4-hydroxy-6-hydroxymethyldihydropteridine diphosphokinase [Burkholderiaceae bacterium]
MSAAVRAAIGLGANLGDPAAAIARAVDAIARLPGCSLAAVSPYYRTAPVDATGPDFVNAVALVDTTRPPAELLVQLLAIEQQAGRERPSRNAPRTLDLDLLLYGDARVDTPALQVPHPRMHLRAFVLVPLLDVWPDAMVPGKGAVRDLLAQVRDQPIERLEA